MIIKSISCTQFAGVRDRNVSFTDGINVIYGKNESGKSTLVNLLSRTLFQNAQLDRRCDKEFYELYFPGTIRGSSTKGDFADGNITIETENGEYTLTKVWGTDSRCILSTPDGIIRDQRKINEILREVLLYGEGVYSDILFSSQRNTDVSLQMILDASKKSDAKKEIIEAVSQAFAETDGISVDAIEQAICVKIDEIAGKHWDFEREAPARARNSNRWSKDLGKILNAYYELEDAKAVLAEISRLEDEVDRVANEYATIDVAAQKAEDTLNRFNKYKGHLDSLSLHKEKIELKEKEKSKITEALTSWPQITENLEKAKALQSERAGRDALDKYEATKKIRDKIAEIETGAVNKACPTDAEILQVKSAKAIINSLENKLCSMNITAAIDMLSGNQVVVTSLRTKKTIDVSCGIASITEAVRITVPGVMEMKLSPADVDVASVEAQLSEQKNIITGIYEKYGVASLEELETLAKDIEECKRQLDIENNNLKSLLGTVTFEELEAEVAAISTEIRFKDEIDKDIFDLCGSDDISNFIIAKEVTIDNYTKDYVSINDLRAKAFKLDEELKKEMDSVSEVEDIPDEYRGISDPEAHLKCLQNDRDSKRNSRDEAFSKKTIAISKLESYKEGINNDPVAEVEEKERFFEETKSLLNHWRHIKEVFMKQKENISSNPMEDIADCFARYLSVISGGKVESEFPETDKLNMNIYSGKKLLDYRKLSEGTKETVSLAFRLAVIDHLFPEGGGVIVLDDPFVDMDAERTAQSCELVKECAKRHQVIFSTCKCEYADMLAGNRIEL